MGQNSTKNGIRILATGSVQGVGFRPFVYRTARELDLNGWVCNSARGLEIVAEGPPDRLENLIKKVDEENPPAARVQSLQVQQQPKKNYEKFEIRSSDSDGKTAVQILPDLATCSDCSREIQDPDNRRHRYAFTNCTNCGPRFSIINSLPYDRRNTSMSEFAMCDDCRSEYEFPLDRRFHAQPNACSRCGPKLRWHDGEDQKESGPAAIERASEQLANGKVVAAKGLGGFHLLGNARAKNTVKKIRRRKQRPANPLALMYPGIEKARSHCHVSEAEASHLCSPEAPILLLEERPGSPLSELVAPGTGLVGVMLPYTPLHELLLEELRFPLVATSGNLSGQPIRRKNKTAVKKLGQLVAGLLLHDRKIERPVDDSVGMVYGKEIQLTRRSRGYVPRPIEKKGLRSGVLALGGQMKNTVALTREDEIITSQHLGDLKTTEAVENYSEAIDDLLSLYELQPEVLAVDHHPDYYPTGYGETRPEPVLKVQHHHAHVASCMVDRNLEGKVLGVAFDGSGYGTDGTVWGGELLRTSYDDYERFGRFRRFSLPGGEKAVREPARSALGVLAEIDCLESIPGGLKKHFDGSQLEFIKEILRKQVNCPRTSSAGRLFDAVAALLGVEYSNTYTGQAPVKLENTANNKVEGSLELAFKKPDSTEATGFVFDWGPAVVELLDRLRKGQSAEKLAALFHNTLAEAVGELATRQKCQDVVLTGGCFQNRLLTDRVVGVLKSLGLNPYTHRGVPPNDGGLSVGQAAVVGGSPDDGEVGKIS